ncbi:MAG: hypothetical protein ACOVQX_01665 [Legionella sp.]
MMFNHLKKIKLNNLNKFGCSGKYQHTFFSAFDSVMDMNNNVKALIAVPILNFTEMLSSLITALRYITVGLINIIAGLLTFSLEQLISGYHCHKKFLLNLFDALYYGVSIITDTLVTFTALLTHSLATLGLGLHNIGEAILSALPSL